MAEQKVWFVTGASKGLGFDIVKAALAKGEKVVATVRGNADELNKALNDDINLFIVTLDITREEEVKRAVEKAVDKFGRLDVVVNNAGFGVIGAIEEVSDAEVRKQYDTNVFGLLNVVRSVLPQLRNQRSGHIINFSSLFGYGAIPAYGLYGSTKFAVEGISAALSVELEPFNIRVTSLAPGVFRTQFLSSGSYLKAIHSIDDYNGTLVDDMKNSPKQLDGNQSGDPAKLAQVVLMLADVAEPPLHLPVGKDSLALYLKSVQETQAEIEKWKDYFPATEVDIS